MEENYNIDKHLRKSLQQMNVSPMDSSFARTMQKLDQKKKRRRFFIFLYSVIGGIAALLCLFFGIASNSNDIKKDTYTEITSSAKQKTNPDKIEENKIAKQVITNPDKAAKNSEPVKDHTNSVGNHYDETKINSEKNEMSGGESNEQPVVKNKPGHHVQKSGSNGAFTAPETNANDAALFTTTKVKTDSLSTAINVFYLPVIFPVRVDSGLNELSLLNPDPSPEFKIDSLKKKSKRIHWMVAVNGDPQYSDYFFSKNKNRSALFDRAYSQGYQKQYLDNKREASKPYLTHAYGLKAGVLIKDQWELWVGFGIQRIKYLERPIPAALNNFSQQSASYVLSPVSKNIYYSAELRRIVQIRPFLKMNFGAGFRMNRGYYSDIGESKMEKVDNTIPTTIAPTAPPQYLYDQHPSDKPEWDCRVDIKGGVIYDLGKRFQLRLSPGIFYTPTSMLSKTYLIKQKAYGAELECLFVFKFN